MPTIIKSDAFAEWIDNLRDRAGAAQVLRRLARLERGNPGNVAPVGEGVSELKIDFGPGYRVYFGQRGQELVIILAGGDKSEPRAGLQSGQETVGRMEGAKPMTKAKFSAFDVADHIKTPDDAAHYLDAVLADGDANEIAEALGVVARSQGMAAIAEESGLSRETLYRTLSDAGNPRLATLLGILRAMGLRLSVAAA